MRIWLLLFLGFCSMATQAQNLESVLSINEVGLEATFSNYIFDEDGNLYVALNLGFGDVEDSSQFVILNHPNGRDTFYYQYKRRIILLKLTPEGELTKTRIDYEDGLSYDFFPSINEIIFFQGRIYTTLPTLQSTTRELVINGEKSSITNDTCLYLFNIITFDDSLKYLKSNSYGMNKHSGNGNFYEINNQLFLDARVGDVLGGMGDLDLIGDFFEVQNDGSLKHFGKRFKGTLFNDDQIFDNNTLFNFSLDNNAFAYDTIWHLNTNGVANSLLISSSKNNFYLGKFAYRQYFDRDSTTFTKPPEPFVLNHQLSDYVAIPDSQNFSANEHFFGVEPEGEVHFFSYSTIFLSDLMESSTGAFVFTLFNLAYFDYNFGTDSINLSNSLSNKKWQLGVTEITNDGEIQLKGIYSFSNETHYFNNDQISVPHYNSFNGYFYFQLRQINRRPPNPTDSIPGFPFDPNKVIARYTLFAPPKHVPDILFTQKDCSSGLLEFKSKDAEHYTVLIANDTIRSFPKSGKNYNYSPNYLQAPTLTDNVKIIYQGPDTSLSITNLVSGRKYFIAVVPGNGLPSKTLYNPDSTAFIEFTLTNSTTPKPDIFPKNDTSLCTSDTIYTKALTSYRPRWMDGRTAFERFVAQAGSYSYTIKDSNNCIISSDTVLIEKRPNPRIDSIYTLEQEPFCLGDTFNVVAVTKGDIIWSTGSRDKSIKVDTNGNYKVAVSNTFGCSDSAQITIEFQPKPYFNFLLDSIIAIDGQANIDFKTNAAKTDFIYQNDTFSSANIVFDQDGMLKANTFANSGCWVSDSMLIKVLESQPEIFPNAFSPNNDGLNDEWFFIHPDTAGTLIIYDRWGGIVHHGINRWDGKKNGETLPVGAYRYTFIPSKGELKRGLIFLVK